VSLFFTECERTPKPNLEPYLALGQVMAEEASKLLAGKSEVMVVTMLYQKPEFKNPAMEACLKTFRQTLSRSLCSSGLMKDRAQDLFAALWVHRPMPKGSPVVQVLKCHGHKLGRGPVRKVGALCRLRKPATNPLQFVQQLGVFGQALRRGLIGQVPLFPGREMAAHVVPVLDLSFEIAPQAPGEVVRFVGRLG